MAFAIDSRLSPHSALVETLTAVLKGALSRLHSILLLNVAESSSRSDSLLQEKYTGHAAVFGFSSTVQPPFSMQAFLSVIKRPFSGTAPTTDSQQSDPPERFDEQALSDQDVVAENRFNNVPNIVDYVFGGEHDIDRQVLIDPEEPTRFVTKRTAMRLVDGLSGKFDDGSTVCMHISNDILYPVLYLSILASGAKWMGTNTAYTPSELAHLLGISQARYIITEQAFIENVKKAIEISGIEAKIIIFTHLLRPDNPTTAAREVEAHETLTGLLRHPRASEPKPKIDLDAPAVLMSTSGTTGLPKLAARSHRAIVLESIAIQDPVAKPYPIRRLFCTPIFHAFSAPLMLLAPLREGHTTYIMKRFHGPRFTDYISKYQITETAAPPTMLQRLCELDDRAKNKLHSLRLVWTGGAPLAPALEAKFLNTFPSNRRPRVVPVWGMTEGGWFSTIKYHPALDTHQISTSTNPPLSSTTPTATTTTTGQLLPGYELKLLYPPIASATPPHPSPDPATRIGELLIRSPTLLHSYLSNPSATTVAYHNPGTWFKTGDLGYYTHPTGTLHLIGRAKDMIKINGFQVAPAELEAAILAFEGVRDVAVVGAGQGVEERGVGFLILEEGVGGLDEEGLRRFLRERLAGFKVRGLEVRVLEGGLPRSGVGKVLRGSLREMV